MRHYTVREGDTLWSIAKALYGDPSLYRELALVNHITDPGTVAVGQVLWLPDGCFLRGLGATAGGTQAGVQRAIQQEVFGSPGGSAGQLNTTEGLQRFTPEAMGALTPAMAPPFVREPDSTSGEKAGQKKDKGAASSRGR